MNKIFTLLLLSIVMVTAVRAQKAPPATQPYGNVDQADLEMKACDFEKDANAEVLFDKAKISSISSSVLNTNIGLIYPSNLKMERHMRIKIFNDQGKNEASFSFAYYSALTKIVNIQAETINLENGKIVLNPLDKKLIYDQKARNGYSAITFTFPDVKPGSVIEFKYTQMVGSGATWYFQSHLPTRYSEVETDVPDVMYYRFIPHVNQSFVKYVGKADDFEQVRALANIPSLPSEPYMGARIDNLQRMECISINPLISTWAGIGNVLCKVYSFGGQLDNNVKDEGTVMKQVKDLKDYDEKIAFIFNLVKNTMRWDGAYSCFTGNGTDFAWSSKIGNSAEINMILCHLLNKARIKAYPMVVSTKNNGKISPASPNVFILNNTIVYVPIDSTKDYILDATSKFNLYNEMPMDQLNSFGLCVDADGKAHKMIYFQKPNPALQSIYLNTEIKPDGQMSGTAQITSSSYNKIMATRKYKTDGEEKYIDSLQNHDNNLKILSVKMDNMEVDSLPLLQNIEFNVNLQGSDKDYIYFNTNWFMPNSSNPFLSENRLSDVDFGYRDNFVLYGTYKLPQGYKIDVLPKTVTIVMPDKSISFKRTTAEEDGNLMVKYVLNHGKTIYFKEEYQDLRGFYKKMYELLNEQIVLKKS
jgi:hypothetical protein